VDYYNKHWFDYTGLSLEDIKNSGWTSGIHPDDIQDYISTWTESVNTGKLYQMQYRKQAESGEYRWHLGRAVPMRNEKGEIVKWYGTSTDIDDLRKSKEDLKTTQEKLKTILQNVPMVLWAIDEKGIYTFAEGKGLENVGFNTENLVGKPHSEIFSKRPDLLENVNKALRGESFNYRIMYNNRVLETYYNPLKNEIDVITGMVAVSFDVTEGEKAQTANLLKSRFLANMSHEIRTPLNAILGFSRILNSRQLSEEQKQEYIKHISSSGLILLKLIGDILDLNKIEEGKMELNLHVFNFKEVVLSELNPYQFKANEKGLNFKIFFDESIPKYIKSDSFRIMQILINLIGNAIKFTKEGEITVMFENEEQGNPHKARIKITVSDTGIGIPSEKQNVIFESFTQADSSIVREFGGSGLGLNITRQISDLLKGELKIISPNNVKMPKGGPGSTFQFIFEVPVENIAPPVIDAKEEPLGVNKTLSILVAEDNLVNQLLIKALLEEKVVVLDIVSNGLEALEKVESRKYDLILMDIQMPVMDGFTAAREIRGRGFSMPILGITANVHKDDIANCFSAGMNDFIGKPINETKLYETINKWSSHSSYPILK